MGFVYLIQQGADSCFKIGSSESGVVERLKGLQTGNPVKLRIFGTIEVSEYEKLEADLHNEFKAFREEGEWFLIDPTTAVRILNKHDGNLCVDDPYKFTVKQSTSHIDISAITKLIKDDVAATTFKWFQEQLDSFIDKLNITTEMAHIVAARRVMRLKRIRTFLFCSLSVFIVASAICFSLFFYVWANTNIFDSKMDKPAYWDFSTHNLIGFFSWEAVIATVACFLGVCACEEIPKPTDAEIDWEKFILTKKKLLRKK